jgi:hypothetical protein
LTQESETEINHKPCQSNPFHPLENDPPQRRKREAGAPGDMEDFGDRIMRRSNLPPCGPSTQSTDDVGVVQVENFSGSDSRKNDNDVSALQFTSGDIVALKPHKRLQIPEYAKANSKSSKPSVTFSNVTQNPVVSTKPKKRKVVRDEIDDIFGI